MSNQTSPVIVKKYANRRLYNTGTSSYVTLDDLAEMVRRGEEFIVRDAKTGEEITRGVLGQIIFEAESKGEHLLPISFLRQLIQYYGDSMQSLVPAFLDQSMLLFSRDREKFRQQFSQAFTPARGFDAVEEQVRRNMDLFEKSMRMFIPFGHGDAGRAQPPKPDEAPSIRELDELRDQVRHMQSRIDQLVELTHAGRERALRAAESAGSERTTDREQSDPDDRSEAPAAADNRAEAPAAALEEARHDD